MTKTVALLSDHPISPDAFASMPKGFESRVFTESASMLQDVGLHVLAVRASTLAESDIAGLVASQMGGIILLNNIADTSLGAQIIEAARQRGIPLVVYGNSENAKYSDRCWSDHELGAYQLTKFLLSRGKRKIQPFWRFAAKHHWVQCREIGYQKAMAEAGLAPLAPIRTPDLPTGDGLSRAQFEDTVRLLAGYLVGAISGPNAADSFMVASDPHVYEVSAALKLLGADPGKFPIVGYDNSYPSLPMRQWSPRGPVATIEKDNSAMGRELSALLLDRMHHRSPPEPQLRLVPPRLIEIESDDAE